MVKLLEFLDRHTARHLFRSSHLKYECEFFSENCLLEKVLNNPRHTIYERLVEIFHFSCHIN